MNSYLGNHRLLEQHKVGFLASSKIATLSVLPTLDWASDIAKREDVTVVIGCHSQLEKQVLDFLLRGRCSIIIALHRGIYKTIPNIYKTAYEAERILFLSIFSDRQMRAGRAEAFKRNKYITELSDEMVFASITPESSLYELYNNIKDVKPTNTL